MTRDIVLFLHVIGFAAMGGMFLFAYAAEILAWRSGDRALAAGVLRLKGAIHSTLVQVMALITLASGIALGLLLDYDFLSPPWFAAMWIGFFLGAALGRIVGKPHVSALYQALTEAGSDEAGRIFRQPLKRVLVSMDVPLIGFLIYLGVARPMAWGDVALAFVVAIVVAALMAGLILKVGPKAATATQSSSA